MKVLKTICMGIGAVALLFSCSSAPKARQTLHVEECQWDGSLYHQLWWTYRISLCS